MASLHREDQRNPCAGWLWSCASVPLSSSSRSSSTLPASSGHSGFEDEDAEHQDPLSHPLNYFLPACRSRSFWRTRVRKREFKKKRRWSRSWASWRKSTRMISTRSSEWSIRQSCIALGGSGSSSALFYFGITVITTIGKYIMLWPDFTVLCDFCSNFFDSFSFFGPWTATHWR